MKLVTAVRNLAESTVVTCDIFIPCCVDILGENDEYMVCSDPLYLAISPIGIEHASDLFPQNPFESNLNCLEIA